MKEDYQSELHETRSKSESQQQSLLAKCDLKRKKYKDLESELHKKVNDAVREKDIAESKLQNLQN